MTWHMVHFSELESLRASLQFLAFSEAYLEAAKQLCGALAACPADSSFPKGAVVMSVTLHGIELFLKAAILEKAPTEQFSGNVGHDLERLHKRYANLYPGKKYAFEAPFRTEELVLGDPDPHIIEDLKRRLAEHKRATPADQLHRYPRDSAGNLWEGFYSFEASSFAGEIGQVQKDILRLKDIIFSY